MAVCGLPIKSLKTSVSWDLEKKKPSDIFIKLSLCSSSLCKETMKISQNIK